MTRTQPSGTPPPSAAPAAAAPAGSSLRTAFLGLFAAGFGLLVGYAALTITGDSLASGEGNAVPLAVPALTKIRMRVRLMLPTSPAQAAPSGAPAGGDPDAPGKR
jgi:hypothetical protein